MSVPATAAVQTYPFQADVDVAELDERGRPGGAWGARTDGLSRSVLVLVSRRPVYVGRELVVAVHMIDAEPTPLFGAVASCEYDGEGRHRIVLTLRAIPKTPEMHTWVTRGGRR